MAIRVRWFNPGPKVYWRGRWFDKAMVIAFTDLERAQGFKEYFYQGSYSTGVSTSAGTHARGGVSDIVERGLSHRRSMARRGVVGWHRTRAQGFMDHDHNILMWSKTGSPALKAQMFAYRAGYNGLVGNRSDDSGTRGSYVHYLDWRQAKRHVQPRPKPNASVKGINDSRRLGKNGRPYYSVKLLQHALNKLYPNALKEDGIYGSATAHLYNRFRVRIFGRGPQAVGSIGAQGLKLLFSRAHMRVNVVS